jgi:hypothetical protein
MAKINLVPYFEVTGGYGEIYYKVLKPTGRWKLETTPYNSSYEMWIEHKGLIFKSWIPENQIVFKPKRTSVVFECEDGK